MPIYEYRCVECEHQLETLQKMGEDPLVDCPNCNRPGLKKKVSAAAFRLKGGGWYETDFKSGEKKNVASDKAEGSSSTDTGTKSDAGGSAKSDSGASSKESSKDGSSSSDKPSAKPKSASTSDSSSSSKKDSGQSKA